MSVSRRSWMLASGTLMALCMAGGGVWAAGEEVVIGVPGPFSGANAASGAEMRQGAEIAAEDLNAKGGILGRRIRLEIADDASDPKQGVAVANRLVGGKVAAILGHLNSNVSIPASGVYAEANLLMVTPGATNPLLTDQAADNGWSNIFRTIGRDDAQGTFAGTYIAKTFAGKRVAIVHDKTAQGKGLVDEMKKALNGRGVKEVSYDSVNVGERDFSSLLSKLKSERIDVIYYGGLYTEAGLIVRQAAEHGLKVTMVSGDGSLNPVFWEVAGSAGEGTLMTFPADPRTSSGAASVVERMTARNLAAGGYTLYTYAALQVIAEAATRVGSFDTAAMAKALRDGPPVQTVAGPLSFDKKGDVKDAKFVMFVWRNGQYVPVGD